MANNKLTWTALIILSLFVILLFTKWEIEAFQLARAERQTLEETNKTKSEEHKKLDSVNSFLNSKKKVEELVAEFPSFKKERLEELKLAIPKYSVEFKEDEILSEIYSLISNSARWTNSVSIKNLNLTPWVVWPMQFLESNINLSLEVPNEKVLRNILDKLNKTEKYKYFITSLNYQKPENLSENWINNIQIQIPLKVYYK